MAAPAVGFLIIGAQKAGTTSLFEYLRRHPQVHMAPQKEIGFFSSEVNYQRGWDWYESMATSSAPDDVVCGEASVGYMSGTVDTRGMNGAPQAISDVPREEIIPRRISTHLPDAKLIAVLRDPVERCYSHYRMAVLGGLERRSFEEAIGAMLAPDQLERDRATVTGSNGYVARGEYFRILSGYWRTFPAEQVMVVFSRDLKTRTPEVLARTFAFVGVDDSYLPPNLDVRYREAAVARRIRGFDLYAWQRALTGAKAPRAIWHALPGPSRAAVSRAYSRASFRVEMWNARRGELRNDVPESVLSALTAHFRTDGEALASALGVEVPWLARWG